MIVSTPISESVVSDLRVGDVVSISGYIYTGRDAVLPKIVKAVAEGNPPDLCMDLHGWVIFHTAVCPACVGPTNLKCQEL